MRYLIQWLPSRLRVETMQEEEIRKKVMELETSRAQLDTLVKQDEILRLNIEEFMRARDTLNGIKGSKSGENMLVPIGANFFIHAKLDEVDKVISNLGSTIAAEESIGEALKRLDRHIDGLNKAGQDIASNVAELEAKCGALTRQLQEVYAQSGIEDE